MKILTLITTYNRPELCTRLVEELVMQITTTLHDSEKPEVRHGFLFVDDGNNHDYITKLIKYCRRYAISADCITMALNNGKEGYWSTMNQAFKYMSIMGWSVLVQLPDDVIPVPDFYTGALDHLAKANTLLGGKILINLYKCHRFSEWGALAPAPLPDTTLDITAWMDMCYIANRGVIIDLDYTVQQVFRNWSTSPEMGSGVGAQLSRRLRAMGIPQLQVRRSLVIDDGEQLSQMNPNRPYKIKSL